MNLIMKDPHSQTGNVLGTETPVSCYVFKMTYVALLKDCWDGTSADMLRRVAIGSGLAGGWTLTCRRGSSCEIYGGQVGQRMRRSSLCRITVHHSP